MWLAKVAVTLKKSIFDPQGRVLEGALSNLGYTGVEEVRVGKYMELKLKSMPKEKAEEEVKEICTKLLSNPVIEVYSFELLEVEQ